MSNGLRLQQSPVWLGEQEFDRTPLGIEILAREKQQRAADAEWAQKNPWKAFGRDLARGMVPTQGDAADMVQFPSPLAPVAMVAKKAASAAASAAAKKISPKLASLADDMAAAGRELTEEEVRYLAKYATKYGNGVSVLQELPGFVQRYTKAGIQVSGELLDEILTTRQTRNSYANLDGLFQRVVANGEDIPSVAELIRAGNEVGQPLSPERVRDLRKLYREGSISVPVLDAKVRGKAAELRARAKSPAAEDAPVPTAVAEVPPVSASAPVAEVPPVSASAPVAEVPPVAAPAAKPPSKPRSPRAKKAAPESPLAEAAPAVAEVQPAPVVEAPPAAAPATKAPPKPRPSRAKKATPESPLAEAASPVAEATKAPPKPRPSRAKKATPESPLAEAAPPMAESPSQPVDLGSMFPDARSNPVDLGSMFPDARSNPVDLGSAFPDARSNPVDLGALFGGPPTTLTNPSAADPARFSPERLRAWIHEKTKPRPAKPATTPNPNTTTGFDSALTKLLASAGLATAGGYFLSDQEEEQTPTNPQSPLDQPPEVQGQTPPVDFSQPILSPGSYSTRDGRFVNRPPVEYIDPAPDPEQELIRSEFPDDATGQAPFSAFPPDVQNQLLELYRKDAKEYAPNKRVERALLESRARTPVSPLSDLAYNAMQSPIPAIMPFGGAASAGLAAMMNMPSRPLSETLPPQQDPAVADVKSYAGSPAGSSYEAGRRGLARPTSQYGEVNRAAADAYNRYDTQYAPQMSADEVARITQQDRIRRTPDPTGLSRRFGPDSPLMRNMAEQRQREEQQAEEGARRLSAFDDKLLAESTPENVMAGSRPASPLDPFQRQSRTFGFENPEYATDRNPRGVVGTNQLGMLRMMDAQGKATPEMQQKLSELEAIAEQRKLQRTAEGAIRTKAFRDAMASNMTREQAKAVARRADVSGAVPPSPLAQTAAAVPPRIAPTLMQQQNAAGRIQSRYADPTFGALGVQAGEAFSDTAGRVMQRAFDSTQGFSDAELRTVQQHAADYGQLVDQSTDHFASIPSEYQQNWRDLARLPDNQRAREQWLGGLRATRQRKEKAVLDSQREMWPPPSLMNYPGSM